MMNQAFSEASIKDMSTIIPMAFGVIVVGVLILIASPIAMISTVIVVFMSIVAAMGTAGWLGFKLTPPSASAPTLILTLAVADCVHFLVTLYQNLRKGMDRHAAVIESLRINISPIFLTSITTAIGFLSLNASDAPPFRDLGNITAMGVMYAFVFAVTFLPAFAAVMPTKVKLRDENKATSMDKLANFVIAQRKPMLYGMAIVIVGLSVLVPKNELNDVFVEYFDRSVPFRVQTDEVTDKLSGLYIIDYSVDSKEEGGVSNPEFLADVERFERHLEQLPEVQHVTAIVASFQHSIYYCMRCPYLMDWILIIRSILTNPLPAYQAHWKIFPLKTCSNTPNIATIASGPTIMFSHISLRNIVSMLSGTAIALVLISLILVFALRSVKFGLISLIPNIAPALMAFGVWGLMVGEVGLAVSVVVAMTLGIVVDDTIHFLSKYLRARRERGMNTEDAIRYAFNTVGVALSITTVVLVAGFLVIAQSNFQVNSQMGMLTAVTIAIALIVDFLFLPALLLKLDKDPDSKQQHSHSSSDNHRSISCLAAASFLASVLHAPVTAAQSAEERGLEIATAVQAQDDGFVDSQSSMTMTLINRSGRKSVRKMRSRVLEVADDGDKSMSIFDEPADVKGTASLTHSHAIKADEQWLYLPALKRVKRISSKNKSGPFMGSEFAFEDISSQEVDKYTYKYLGEDTFNGMTVHRIEAIPAYKHSGYTRLINWIDTERLVPVKVEFFDRKNSPLKTLTISEYEQHLNQFWRAGRMEMQNEQTGKSTILEWSDYEFQSGLTDKDFESKALKRIR